MNKPEVPVTKGTAAPSANPPIPVVGPQPTPQEAMKGPFTQIPPKDAEKAPVIATTPASQAVPGAGKGA